MIKIAVIGLANVGKTTFLNTLTNSNLKTANFAGSTTKKHEVAFLYKNTPFLFVDLPGFNSVQNIENDLAKEAVKTLKSGNFDYIFHISNAEFPYFSSLLLKEIKQELPDLQGKIVNLMNFPSFKLQPEGAVHGFEDITLFSALSKENCNRIMDFILEKNPPKGILNLLKFKDQINATKVTKVIDSLALSPIFGIPLFFLIMFGVFSLSFIIGKGFGDFLVSGFDYTIEVIYDSSFFSPFFKALLKSMLVGVGTVIGFMPPIIICISLISLLEQTGYITRICFLLDKVFEKFNLGGKSLIPLIVGAGCSITAYLSSRMINDPKEKFLTMVIVGFIPCTAKLSVFMLFAMALFGDYAPIAIFVVYVFGFVFGLLCVKFISLFMKNEAKREKTKVEVFNYRMPRFKSIVKTGYSRMMDYVKNAATFIAIFATAISLLGLIGFENGGFLMLEEGNLERSLIGKIGEFLVPLFKPMDFDYRMIISLITGLVAKEVAVATLAVLYSSTQEGLINIINAEIGFRHAASYLAFMFFYLPCVAATASFYREVGSMKKTLFLIFFTITLAYLFATLVYQIL